MSTSEDRVREIIREELAKLGIGARTTRGGVDLPEGWTVEEFDRPTRKGGAQRVEKLRSPDRKTVVETLIPGGGRPSRTARRRR